MKLDELIAFNEELAALSRAGLPLDRALLRTTHDVPGTRGPLARDVGERLQQGCPLSTALEQAQGIPPLYAAAVAAGERSGHLTAVLERLSATLGLLRDLRHTVFLSLCYPVFVSLLAILLCAFFLPIHMKPLEEALDFHNISANDWLDHWFLIVGRYAAWLAILPPVLFGVVGWWRTTSRRAEILQGPAALRGFGWLPGGAAMVRDAQMAAFTEFLSLLVQQNVPLTEALPLAAEATDGKGLRRDAMSLQKYLDAGQQSFWRSQGRNGISPLVSWVLQSTKNPTRLANLLQHISQSHIRQLHARCAWLRTLLPTAGTLGLAVVTAAIAIFFYAVPWTTFLYRLGHGAAQ